MAATSDPDVFTSAKRKRLFLEMAAREDGATPADVYKAARDQGDTVTEEAYYNIGRRLAHRGLLQADGDGTSRRYFARSSQDQVWIDEDDLWELVDPDYPLLALMIANESTRQMRSVPEHLWVELRQHLCGQSARQLFQESIESYCRDFADQIAALVAMTQDDPHERARLRREADVTHLLLVCLAKHGLGLSQEAVDLPINVAAAIASHKKEGSVARVQSDLLREELARRVSDEPFIVNVDQAAADRKWLIGAVDGSTRGGVLSFLGEEGDFVSGHAPLVSINTSVGQVNRDQQIGTRTLPTFLRLPERPEDMQREDNRFTVMAKLLYPDMSDGKYMHAVWNAMDLIEARAAQRLLSSWSAPKTHVEIPPADVVLKDGAVAPQDRDFNHYIEFDTYGRIVREAIEVNWKIAKQCKEDGQTVAGIIKTAQLSVFAPVVNWFASQVAARGDGELAGWPMQMMNLLPDQMILTHLLTAGRVQEDPWTRTCLTVRPFHSLTNFARTYRRSSAPSNVVMRRYRAAMRDLEGGELDPEKEFFWTTYFRHEYDPYVQMLNRVAYAGFYVGCVPRLDLQNQLPRVDFLVNGSNAESDDMPWDEVRVQLDRLTSALQQNGFDVAAEHNMFDTQPKIDVLPSLLVRAHDTVKHWAEDLLSRVQEYVGSHLSRYVHTKKLRGIKIRPFTRSELRLLYSALKEERDAQSGRATHSIEIRRGERLDDDENR